MAEYISDNPKPISVECRAARRPNHMSDANRVSRRIFEEVWNNKDIDAIDELMAADYVHHDPQSPKFSGGKEGYKQLVEYYLKAFPDSHFTIDQEIQQGDTAVTRWTVRGTHKGDLQTFPASGKTFSVSGITVARLQDGKFVESWNNWDALGLMQQLGSASVPTGRAA
jgi:steroid delta-isomerase-like uncharacterized protein